MNITLIFSIIGIIIGWGLKEASDYLKKKIEDKRILNQSLYFLLDLLFIICQYRDVLKAAKNITNISENMRKILMSFLDDDTLNSDTFKKKLDNSVELVSHYDPFLAQELRISITGIYSFNPKLMMPTNFAHFHLQTNEMYLLLFIQRLSKSIENLSLKHSKRYNKIVKSKIIEITSEKKDDNFYLNLFNDMHEIENPKSNDKKRRINKSKKNI